VQHEGTGENRTNGRTLLSNRRTRTTIAALAIAVGASPVWADSSPAFVDVAPDLGIDHVYGGGWEHYVGGGVAAFDCNADGRPELYVAGGENQAALFLNRSTPGQGISLQRATGSALARTGVTGAYPLDVDGDGRLDLAVLRVGENLLFRGRGDCRFEPANRRWRFDGGAAWTTAFSAAWLDGQDWPTLAVGNYVDRDDPDGPFGACEENRVYSPNGAVDGFAAPVPLSPGHCALSMLFSDWGRNGRQDLRISNDRHYYVRDGEEQLWRIDGAPRLYGPEDGWRRLSIWGMGIASRDIDGDGLPEVMLTSMGDQKLRRLENGADRPAFHDGALAAGVTAHRPYTGGDGRPSTGWHAEFGDVDNDGHDDLFIAKGNVQSMGDAAVNDPNNLLMGRPGGRFVEAGESAGVASLARSRGGALVDLDQDGLLDIVAVNRRTPVEIYHNRTRPVGHWLALRIDREAPNRNGVGAWIEVTANGRTQSREITVGGGHAGGQIGWIHFGLGPATEAEVAVVPPDGTPSVRFTLAADRRYVIDDTSAREWPHPKE